MTEPSTTSEPILLEETRNGVRILRMNRPEVKNALSNDLTRALVRSLEEAASDTEVRVVALTGVGGAFCEAPGLADRTPG
jgi:enoyl-CoA hydratase/carnithine racemase